MSMSDLKRPPNDYELALFEMVLDVAGTTNTIGAGIREIMRDSTLPIEVRARVAAHLEKYNEQSDGLTQHMKEFIELWKAARA